MGANSYLTTNDRISLAIAKHEREVPVVLDHYIFLHDYVKHFTRSYNKTKDNEEEQLLFNTFCRPTSLHISRPYRYTPNNLLFDNGPDGRNKLYKHVTSLDMTVGNIKTMSMLNAMPSLTELIITSRSHEPLFSSEKSFGEFKIRWIETSIDHECVCDRLWFKCEVFTK